MVGALVCELSAQGLGGPLEGTSWWVGLVSDARNEYLCVCAHVSGTSVCTPKGQLGRSPEAGLKTGQPSCCGWTGPKDMSLNVKENGGL